VSNVNFYVPTRDLSEETYYTVLVPWILKEYEKALVLDCDIIINHDLAELYNTDISKHYIAAVKEIVYLGFLNNPLLNVGGALTDYTVKKLGLKNPYDYFNAGILLINLSEFRAHFTMNGLLDDISRNSYSIVEQDLLNSICADHVLFLSYQWNYMACLTSPDILEDPISPSDTTIPNLKLAPRSEIEKYLKASEEPYIYHYLTKMKPWRYPKLKYSEIWWRIARNTIYYETIIENMHTRDIKDIKIAIFSLQHRVGIFDQRSSARKLGDKLFPKGTRRRAFAKYLLPKGSLRWKLCKKVYFLISPSSNPSRNQ